MERRCRLLADMEPGKHTQSLQNMSGASCQGRFFFMNGSLFFSLLLPNFPSPFFVNEKQLENPVQRPVVCRQPIGCGAGRPRPPLLGARDPRSWLARGGDRDFIHKSVYSSGQRQEIRALERGNPPIERLDWAQQEKQVCVCVCSASKTDRNDSTAGAHKKVKSPPVPLS